MSILPRASKKQCEAVTAQLSLIWKTNLLYIFKKNEPKMMKADLENAVIMHEKTLGPLSVISGGNLADCLT